MATTIHAQSHTIRIDGMTGDVCVQKVKTALSGVAGVTTDSVIVGSAVIECDEQSQCDAACSAINGAGFKASENRELNPKDNANDPDKTKDAAGIGAAATQPLKATQKIAGTCSEVPSSCGAPSTDGAKPAAGSCKSN